MNDKKIKILMVESVKQDYLLMERALRRSDLDCKITRVLRGKDAIEHLHAKKFDIIILDYSIPGETGLETFCKIKAQDLNVPVVFVSGSGNETVAAEAIRLGAQEYIVKDPHGGYLEILAEALKNALKQWKTEQSRKKAKRKLEESEVKLRSFIESSTIGIWCFGGKPPVDIKLPEEELIKKFSRAICIECNETYAKMMGTTKDKIIGMKLSEVMPDTKKNREYFRAFIRNGFKLSGGISHEIDRKGEEKYFSNSFVGTIREGKLVEAWGTQIDITERKQQELRRQVRAQLLDNLRGARTIEDCLQLSCQAIRDAELFKRAVLTLHNKKCEITHLGQVGLDPKVIEQACKSPPIDEKLIKKIKRQKFKISHSFFVPKEGGVAFNQTGRYILQKSEHTDSKSSWQPGDELFVPIISKDGSIEGYLSVDTPINGKRPDEETILYLEDIVDITARQIHEIQNVTSLQESEERLRAIFETAQDSIFIKDRTLKYTQVNPAMERLFGLPASKLIGLTDNDLFGKEVGDHIRETDSRVLHGEVVMEENTKLVKGTPITFSIIKVPMRDSSGKIIGICGIARDITERKLTEEALQFERHQLLSIFDGMDEIVYVSDPETYDVLYVNQPCRNAFGNIEGKKCFKAFQNLDATCPFCTNKKIFRKNIGKTYIWECQNKINKRWYRCIDRAIKWPDNRWVRYEIAIDITDSKRMSEELRERRIYLENIMEYLPDAVVTQDAKGRILEWNPEAERLFGYTSDEVVGKKVDELVAPPDTKEFKETTGFTRQLLAGKPVLPVEVVRYRKDGTQVDVRLAASPILKENKIIGTVALYRDITEEKRLEREAEERRLYLESVLHSAPDAVITADNKQMILEWNPGAERLFGYTSDEVVGKNIDDLITGHNSNALKEAAYLTQQVLVDKRGVPPTETIRYRKDGTPVDVIVSGSPIVMGGKLFGVVATYIDLTEHKREEKIRESIYRIAEAIVTTKDINELFRIIHDTVKKLMPAENAYITLYNSDTGFISFPYFVDKYDKTPPPKRIGKGLTEYVLRTKRPFLATPKVISKMHKEGKIEIIGTLPISWLGVPLIIDDVVIGVVAVQSYTKGVKYTERDKEILQYVSSQIAQAIRSKQSEEKVYEQMSELQTFHRVTLGRENRIIELKHEVNKLLEHLGEDRKYKV